MKYYLAAIAIGLAVPGTAMAEDFTAEYRWSQPVMTGGIGPQGDQAMAGDITGTYVTTLENGNTVSGTAHCVGMGVNQMAFRLQMACDMQSDSARFSAGMLCLWRGEGPGPGVPLSCVGFLTGKGGALEGRGGMITMDWTGEGMAHAVGQWWPAQQ